MVVSANPLSYVSLWLLLVLLWKPIWYVAQYVYYLVTKNSAQAVVVGSNLHVWLTQLWGLVL